MTARHVLSFAAVMLLPLPASAAETLWTEVTVRVYDATGISADTRRASLEIAASIVSAASVELIWRNCNEPAGKAGTPASTRLRTNPCNRPLAPGELAVRIVRSGRGRRTESRATARRRADRHTDRRRRARDDLYRPRRLDGRTDRRRLARAARAGHRARARAPPHGHQRPCRAWLDAPDLVAVRDPSSSEQRLGVPTDGDCRHQGEGWRSGINAQIPTPNGQFS